MKQGSSDRKTASNRKNAQNSTGPRSEAGRRRSRRNALRHGLAIAIASDPAFGDEIDLLAKAVGNGGQQSAGEFARQFVEAQLDLFRIRKIRALQFSSVMDHQHVRPEDLSNLNEGLAKLERYERRACSRRKRALRFLIE
jgi:hypothetical protein